METVNQSSPSSSPTSISHYALEAPRAPIFTLEEYAEIAAEDARIDSHKFKALIQCESQWDIFAQGDRGTSFGILQFKEASFELFAKKYKLAEADINNPQRQIDLAALMIRDGYLSHWKNCTRKVGWFNQ